MSEFSEAVQNRLQRSLPSAVVQETPDFIRLELQEIFPDPSFTIVHPDFTHSCISAKHLIDSVRLIEKTVRATKGTP